jgi:hypothetical protein
MKYIYTLAFLMVAKLSTAQQLYFIYIQTDNKQPFYVKKDNKLLSSSAAGYLVVPKLNEGEHSFTVGFPKEQWEPQQFTINVTSADAGYLLKNYKDKGWGLYNIQTMQTVMSGSKPPAPKAAQDSDEDFANALSGAANTKVMVAKPKVNVEPVKKLNAGFNNNDYVATYLVTTNGKTDTVRLAISGNIPAIKKVEQEIKEEETKEAAVVSENAPSKPAVVMPENPVVKEAAAAKEITPIKEKVKPVVDITSNTTYQNENKPEVAFNSDCKARAEQEDFIKVRKKMAAQDGDDDMIAVALKAFKTKCFTVEQIKNLSILLLSDKGKYNFFDTVYEYAYDTNNYKSLATEMKDEYYINRFKAMLKR